MKLTTSWVRRCRRVLSPLKLGDGALVHNIPGVRGGRGLKQQNPAFLRGDRTVLHAARHHNKLALFDPLVAVAKFHAEASLDHQEHLVFVVMMMKDELALQLVELD